MSSFNFAQLPQADIARSKFDRSHGYKIAFDSGTLVPFFADEVLPGDTFDLQTAMVARLATPIVPVMDNIHIDTFFFFVPNRLVWNNWERFMGQQDNPGDSIDYLVPTVNLSNGHQVGSMFDHLGIPPGIQIPQVDWPIALPFRACNLIWNEWFRDQNLQDSRPVEKGDGPDPANNYLNLRRGKRHDYFTSALPWPQKGESIPLPLGGTAPVMTMAARHENDTWPGLTWANTYGTPWIPATNNKGLVIGSVAGETCMTSQDFPYNTADSPVHPDNLYADLSEATATSINNLRQAFQIQKFMERAARSGTRYTEIIRNFFGVVSPDSRLQRPEFLGGSEDYINMHQVAQTSSTDGATPQGNLAAFGYMNSRKHGFTKSFTEHGWVIGFVNVWTDLSYQQGMRREFSRRTRWDYYWPDFAHLGEQGVLNKEIYLSDNATQNNEAFGYQERYAEYRYHPSLIVGKMRSTVQDSLDVWHLAQKFDSLPKLNSAFIEERPPLARVLAVQNEPQIILDAWFNLKCTRPMPLYSIPGLGYRV